MRRINRRRSAFTLIEIMIVAALIALLSGIAIFSINEFYNAQIKKAAIAECNQIATGLSFAQNDFQFYPRYNYLNLPKSLVMFNQTTGLPETSWLVESVDYYGFLTGGRTVHATRLQAQWQGPYLGQSSTRNRQNRGRGGIVRMRLIDVYYTPGIRSEYSVVEWPADPWGNPYVLYQLKSGVASDGTLVPYFIERETEEGDWLNAVVSYGPNGIPGATPDTLDDPDRRLLREGMLYVIGDRGSGDGGAQFTLKTTRDNPSIPAELKLLNGTPVHQAMIYSLHFVPYDLKAGKVGMLDDGTDDVVFAF